MGSDMVYVESEYAPLKRVILTESEFSFPQQPLSAQELAFLPAESQALFADNTGGDHSELYPERHQRWLQERQNFADLLTHYGVEILKPRKLYQHEKQSMAVHGYSNFFVRDPIFTIGNVVIEGSIRLPHRRNEVLPVRPVVESAVIPADCQYVAVPQPEICSEGNPLSAIGPFLEGGDVLVLGKHVLVGCSGLASSLAGKKWLEKFLTREGYTVELVPLKENILHLDCALSLVREGLMIVCESVFLNGIPDVLKEWERINITEADCAQLGANGLPLSEEVYVIDPFFERTGNSLINHGIHVETVDFTISRSFGGSFRCSTQPLLRQS